MPGLPLPAASVAGGVVAGQLPSPDSEEMLEGNSSSSSSDEGDMALDSPQGTTVRCR